MKNRKPFLLIGGAVIVVLLIVLIVMWTAGTPEGGQPPVNMAPSTN